MNLRFAIVVALGRLNGCVCLVEDEMESESVAPQTKVRPFAVWKRFTEWESEIGKQFLMN